MRRAHPVPLRYRQSLLGPLDRGFRNSLVAASILGFMALGAIYLSPQRIPPPTTVEELPERFAKLILQDRAAPGPVIAQPPPKPAPKVEIESPEPTETPKPKPKPRISTPPRRRTPKPSKPKLAENRGERGRKRAQAEVSRKLASVSTSVNQALSSLSTALPSATSNESNRRPRRRRRNRVRGGRNASQLGAVGTRQTNPGMDGSGSGLDADMIGIEEISELVLTDSAGEVIEGSGSGGGGQISGRSNASLLAVVRRYAPGIRYCYDNALKSDPTLEGKLVFGLKVDAAGKVTEVVVVEDTLGASNVRSCALAQIRSWKFPPSEAGTSSFQTPFVFRPPQ